jgi:hypothetical protein
MPACRFLLSASQLGTIAANGIRDRHDPETPELTQRPIFYGQSRQGLLMNSVVESGRGPPATLLVTSERLAVPT